MSIKLIRQALKSKEKPPRMWREHEIKDSYDVVIIGGGAHGLACAYYLAKNHGITNVAVLEKRYIGSGGSGRNTTIIRSNYLTPEGSAFYNESVKLYEQMSAEFDFNVMFSQRGHFTLAHTDAAMRTSRRRAEVNQIGGIDSRVIGPDEIKRLCPALDVSDRPRYPIMGALYHPPGGIIRHDAVVWGYAHHADRMGVHIHQLTEVTDIHVENNQVVGVQTNRGRINTKMVLNATAGWCTTIADMAGVKLPITTFPLQACVTEPLKPFLDVIIVSGSLHVYVSQSDRGELVMGASVDPFASYSTRGSLDFIEGLAGHMLELFPSLAHVRVLRQWAGLCDMTPDYSPVMGFTPVDGFVVDVGWGTYGFKASPVSGKRMAELIATNRIPDLLHPFRLSRFEQFDLVGEKGAASVGH
ncbi:MAG: FAD-dependent oxidoreductase [Anaerolineales bacterium]|nr:FAD-dependent oxidoreductase [Anaerolineales bacterium]